MSDILSTYYKSSYSIKNNLYKKRNFYTPNRIVKISPDKIFQNLSPYGFYLSTNNFILLPKRKLLPRVDIYGTEYPQLTKESLTQTKDINKIQNNILNKKEEKKFDKIAINKQTKVKKSLDILKLKNELFDFNSTKNKKIKISNISPKIKRNKHFKNKIINDKYLCYTENRTERLDNEKKAEQITNELLSLKTSKEIKNYYLKKESENAKIPEKDVNKIFLEDKHTIDPITYIKFNLLTNPKKGYLFKSFDTQLMIMGNEKYRNNLLDGVNDYKNNVAQYEELRGPTGFDKNRVEEKKRKNIINKMKNNYLEKRGMVFTNQIFKPKSINKKRIFSFEYDENYKDVKRLLNKDIQKYEKNIHKNISKRKMLNVDKKDLNTMNKLDDEAELAIKGIDDMVKFSNKFLSFDEKLNKLVSKTINTTGYLFNRTKEYQKIKMKIDQFYNIEN